MKLLKQLFASVLLSGLLFTACKKESTTETDPTIEATFELTADQATSEFMTEDDNDILMESA